MIDLQTPTFHMLNILKNLNMVGLRVNQISSGDKASVDAVLNLIVESAIEVVPETSAVIYTYDYEGKSFNPESRVAAGARKAPVIGDAPRLDGLGAMSIAKGRRILSYENDSPPIHPINAAAGAKVVACFPLTVAKDNVGALYIFKHENDPFSEIELLVLENFVYHAAMAIYHARHISEMQQDLTRREEETAQLHRAGLLISSHANLTETLEAILKMALEVTHAQYGNFMLMSRDGQELEIIATAGERLSRPNTSNISIHSNTVTGWVSRNRQSICIPDLTEEPWSKNYRSFDVDLQMRSELVVPLIAASGRLIGVLNIESPLTYAFDEKDVILLQGLATHAVITIQDVMLLDAIKSITHHLLTKPHQEVLQELAYLGIDLLNADASAIWVLDGSDLILQASNYEHRRGERTPLKNSLVGDAVIKREPVISENVQTDPRFRRKDLANFYDWEKALVVPLFIHRDQDPVGAFSVYGKNEDQTGRFAESDWDKKVLTILADYGALAVIGARRNEILNLMKDQHTAAETFAALGDISANLMHQLNNKVGTIPVRVQGLQEKSKWALERDTYLADNLSAIEKSAQEAMQQVRENLSLLKPIEMVSVNVENCLEEAIESADLPEKIEIKTSGFYDMPQIKAGKQSLVFIFSNLLENAAAAMDGEGTIELSAESSQQWVKLM